MSDKELLEWAAKSAGMKTDGLAWPYAGTADPLSLLILNERGWHTVWNPLDSDGDCARLETARGIDLTWWPLSVCAKCVGDDGAWLMVKELYADHDNDQGKARRYASTRAAAAIGQSKEGPI